MKKISWLITCVSFFLAACNGPSDEAVQQQDDDVVINQLSVATFNTDNESTISFAKQDTVKVVATLLNSNNTPVANANISFSTTLGQLKQASKLTNTNGQAIIELSNVSFTVRSGTISASYQELSGESDFEFLDTVDTVRENKLSTELLLAGESATHIRTDETVQIKATLVDADDLPIEDEIITFNAELGVLNANTSLTNNLGVATVTLTGNGSIGAGLITVTSDVTSDTQLIKYELLAADIVISDSEYRIGSYDENGAFIEGVIGLSSIDAEISAGGTAGLSVVILDSEDNRVMSSTPVSFSSSCVDNNNATIDQLVFTINGQASATFEDISCAGASGIEDVFQASITINGITKTATASLNILGEGLGSIEFISATPSSIVLKGSGGINQQETSTLTFLVKSAIDNPIPQQEVTFSLDTTVGGIVVFPLSGLTNSQGLITTQVSAGSVPTAVRVTAESSITEAGSIRSVKTQSDLLSINTGLPEQRSISLSASLFNPEANSFNGEESAITIYLADNFNNPVPDGTTVNFTTEGGVIQPSCTTANGRCSVIWTSAEPRVDNHRITILATALGHESFFDVNGNNTFDDSDGAAIVDPQLSSGFKRIPAATSGFVDMSEAWRDDDENLEYSVGETFIDFDNNNTFTAEDGLFNGPQCEGALCAADGEKSINVRDSIVLVMASSEAVWTLSSVEDGEIANNNGTVNPISNIPDNSSREFTLAFSDAAGQTLPFQTSVTMSSSVGNIEGENSYIVPNNNLSGLTSIKFLIVNEAGGLPETGSLSGEFVTPKGVKTSIPIQPISLF